MSEIMENEGVRALLGSLILIGSMVLIVYCCYKLAVCREEEDKKRIKVMSEGRAVCQHYAVCQNCGHTYDQHMTKPKPNYSNLV
jgi:hypothetical protein